MSERMSELLWQAGGYTKLDGSYSLHESHLQKFAELIVRECMEQVWYTREDGINGNVSEVIKDRIKEHFGVEE